MFDFSPEADDFGKLTQFWVKFNLSMKTRELFYPLSQHYFY